MIVLFMVIVYTLCCCVHTLYTALASSYVDDGLVVEGIHGEMIPQNLQWQRTNVLTQSYRGWHKLSGFVQLISFLQLALALSDRYYTQNSQTAFLILFKGGHTTGPAPNDDLSLLTTRKTQNSWAGHHARAFYLVVLFFARQNVSRVDLVLAVCSS